MSSRVTVTQDGQVSVIVLDDGKVNAVNDELLDELEPALDDAVARSRAIVLGGRPGVFSGGFDLGVVGLDGPRAERLVRRGVALTATLYSSPIPVVAACTGHAVALGAVLLMAADYRVGAEGDFGIGLNEVAIGMPLPGALATLARDRLTAARLTEAVLLARIWLPAEAREVGFLDDLAPPETTLARAVHHAKDLAGRVQPDAFAETKDALRRDALALLRSEDEHLLNR
jgi:enoyl-CoA hydratase